MSNSLGSGGGAATQGGINFQNRVAAWAAVYTLAERPAGAIGPAASIPAYIRFETAEPVDDILIGTADRRHAFIQAKRAMSLSKDGNSEFGSVIEQFVRQFLSARNASGPRPWQHALDPSQDRLILVTTTDSSQPLRKHLALVLDRTRALMPGQPFEDATNSADEREALSAATSQVMRAWYEATGSPASDADIREVLALMHVEVLDVEPDGVAEREAHNLLASTIIADRAQAGAAWAKLTQLAADLSQLRSGTDEANLRAALEASGIALKSAPRYERDIATLKAYSRETVHYLAHQSRIRIGGQNIRVDRQVVRMLHEMAEGGSAVVVGIPGAGKSGALHDYAESLINEGRDVVFLAVDQIGAKSLGELRNELGLEHEIIEVMRNWPGAQGGFLIMDAFDAARGEPASGALLTFMRAVLEANTRWNVVASVRKYDLRYSPELRELFRGTTGTVPLTMQDPEFGVVRHLNVPLFSDDELDSARRQSTALDELLAIAPPVLRDLLRVPFNLRLMTEIIESGARVADLRPIRTQSELLWRYWQHRVLGASGGDLRERVLKKTCEIMIQTRRLKAERQQVLEVGVSGSLDELLSENVLIEWQASAGSAVNRWILAFGHNILFDFAVAQLFLPVANRDLVRMVVADPDLVLMIRPSVVMRYQQLWDEARPEFWELFFELCSTEDVPNVGKVIGATVLVESCVTPEEVELLVQKLHSSSVPEADAAETVFRHVVGALTAASPARLVSSNAPWCAVLRAVTCQLRSPVAGYAQTLLRSILDQARLTGDQAEDAGIAARALLQFAWSQVNRSSWLVSNGLTSVCRTFGSNPLASAELLRRALLPEHVAEYGSEELPLIAREVRTIAVDDAGFVADVYAATFGHEETSMEPTNMSGSQILSLVSHRKQDFDHAKWQLAEDYPTFLSVAPVDASKALLAVVEAYCAQHHRSETPPETFKIVDTEAALIHDYSCIWDDSSASLHDQAHRILDAFFHELALLVGKPEAMAIVDQLLAVLMHGPRQAVIWRRLLRLGATHPETFGRKIRSLLLAPALLWVPDTEQDAEEFLVAMFPLLEPDEKQRCEEEILALPDSPPDRIKASVERLRARLLGRLGVEALITAEAKDLLLQLQADNAVPLTVPRRPLFEVTSGVVDELFYLEEVMGVPTETEAHARFLDLHRPVQAFNAAHSNTATSPEGILAALPRIQALYSGVQQPDAAVDEKLLTMASGTLAQACKIIAHSAALSCDSPPGNLARTLLLALKDHPCPEHDASRDASFDKSPSWGSPLARIEAASGLILLARHRSCCSPEVLDAVDQLATDAAPEVRYQIANGTLCLHQTAPERMWALLERRADQETSNAVRCAYAGSLSRVSGRYPERVFELTKKLYESSQEQQPGAEEARRVCLNFFLGLHVWHNHDGAKEILYALLNDVQGDQRDIEGLLSTLREPLGHGDASAPKPEDAGIRMHAQALFGAITRAAVADYEAQLLRLADADTNGSDKDAFKAAAGLVNHVASQLYFASGAFDGTRRYSVE